jgi:hypothetical protein
MKRSRLSAQIIHVSFYSQLEDLLHKSDDNDPGTATIDKIMKENKKNQKKGTASTHKGAAAAGTRNTGQKKHTPSVTAEVSVRKYLQR